MLLILLIISAFCDSKSIEQKYFANTYIDPSGTFQTSYHINVSSICTDTVTYPEVFPSKSNVTIYFIALAAFTADADKAKIDAGIRKILKRSICGSEFVKYALHGAANTSKHYGNKSDCLNQMPCGSNSSVASKYIFNITLLSPHGPESFAQTIISSILSVTKCSNGDFEDDQITPSNSESNNRSRCDCFKLLFNHSNDEDSKYDTSSSLKANTNQLRNEFPTFGTSECSLAYRELVCNLFAWNTSLPSHAHMHHLASQFVASCPSNAIQNIELDTDLSDDMQPNPLSLDRELKLKFKALEISNVSNAAHSNSSSTVEECPYGLVMPADSTKNIVRLPDTNCVVPCPIPTYTKSEMNLLLDNTFKSACVCLALGVFMLINIHQLKESKRGFYLKIQVYLVIAHNAFLALRFALIPELQQLLCDSNASWHSVQHGLKSASGYGCLISGIYIVIEALVIYWSFLAMSTELWLVVVFSVGRNVEKWKTYLFNGSILFFIGHWALTIGFGHPDVLVPGATTVNCWFLDDTNYFWEFFFPCAVYTAISMAMCVHVLVVCLTSAWRVRNNVAGNSFLSNIWKSYSMMIKVLIIYWVQFVPLTFDLLFITAIESNYVVPKGTQEWFACLLKNFVSSAITPDDFMISKCGAHPSDRIPYSTFSLPFIGDYIWTFSVFIVTLNSEARAFWINIFFCLVYKLRLYTRDDVKIFDSDAKENTFSTVESDREVIDMVEIP